MLLQLDITNYALIESVQMKPVRSLNIITGETGAGKSIMIEALGLILGERADTQALYDATSKCVVEGRFDIARLDLQDYFAQNELDYDDECILRREISPSGKSRAFINDTPVTLDIMRVLAGKLVDIHSQHDTTQLGDLQNQLEIVDQYAGAVSQRLAYVKVYKEWIAASQRVEELEAEKAALERERDYHQFLFDELSALSLEQGEQEELEEKLKVAEHAEQIKQSLVQSDQLLENGEISISRQLNEVLGIMQRLRNYGPHYESLLDRLSSVAIELTDIGQEINQLEQRLEINPDEAASTQERLSAIYQLQQKHHVQSVEQLLEIQEQLENKLQESVSIEDALIEAKEKAQHLHHDLNREAKALREKRLSCIENLSNSIVQHLQPLGMPHAQIEIKHQATTPGNTGADAIEILFSANKGVQPKSIKQVASGGEYSRLMFVIKFLLTRKTQLPVLIFDEIDTGVSGEIAMRMGQMMHDMAGEMQLFTITHLPQVAAQGTTHYYIYKDDEKAKSRSQIRVLTGEERTEAIARMIGGEKPTDTAVLSARELLTLSKN